MDPLVEQCREGRCEQFACENTLMENLSHGQHPKILYVGCADSRIMPSRIFGAKPGDVFVMRNVANIVPPATASDHAVGAVVEYAINHLHVAHAVICGHSMCGGIQSLDAVDGDADPALDTWLDYARPACNHVTAELEGDARINATIEANVLLQVQNLRTYPCVQQAEAAGELQIHAWVYDFVCGLVRAYDDKKREFIEEAKFT